MPHLDPSADDFHEKLREARKERNLTQAELADALKISSVMTQRYEMDRSKKNHARPGPETMKKINAFFSAAPQDQADKRPLESNSLDELIAEIRHRGFTVTLQSRGDS